LPGQSAVGRTFEFPAKERPMDTRTALIQVRERRATNGISWITSVLWGGISPEQEAALIHDVTIEQVRAELTRGWRPDRMSVVHSAGGQ
jgi:hypothetical protein